MERGHMKTLKSAGSFLIILLLLAVVLVLFVKNTKATACGDGTKDGQCSARKPYFCSEKLLTENPSACGCPAGF